MFGNRQQQQQCGVKQDDANDAARQSSGTEGLSTWRMWFQTTFARDSEVPTVPEPSDTTKFEDRFSHFLLILAKRADLSVFRLNRELNPKAYVTTTLYIRCWLLCVCHIHTLARLLPAGGRRSKERREES